MLRSKLIDTVCQDWTDRETMNEFGGGDPLTGDLRNIAAWCCKNSLLINPNKTKCLFLGTQQMLAKIPDDLSNLLLSKEIISSKSAKNLGVTMDLI